MKITEVMKTKREALHEAISTDNTTGFLTEDLVSITEAHESKTWEQPVSGDDLLVMIESWIS